MELYEVFDLRELSAPAPDRLVVMDVRDLKMHQFEVARVKRDCLLVRAAPSY